ncbi:MAG: uroporphyrinogen-III C-methyltransferase [Cycloclasticus sp.]
MTDKAKNSNTKKDDHAEKQAPVTTKKAIAKKTASNPVKQKTGGGIGWLAIILVIAATGAGYVAFNQLKQQISGLANDAHSAGTKISGLSQDLQSNSKQSNANTRDLSQQLETLQQQSSEKIALLQKQVGKNRRQWLIAEAEYLASVANTRLLLADDVDTAISALQAADQRLKENGDPITFPVRKQLAKEINLLKSTELPDIVGISSQLLALESAIAQMGVTDPHAGTAQAPEIGKGDASPIPENIQDTLNDAWENFSKLIVVRRHDKPMAALMTPERVELIRKNLALKLETARLALVNKNEPLYTGSIAISAAWLGDYFDANNPAVKTALEQLNVLKETPIKAELPSIALSLKMLRNLPILSISEQAITSPIMVEKTAEKAAKVIIATDKPPAVEKPSANTNVAEQPSDLKL